MKFASDSFDSITEVPAVMRGKAILAASHGGAYVAGLALRLGLGGVIVSDAGIGRERAGIASLGILDSHGMPAAAVDAHSARIGDGQDCLNRGIVSFVNDSARAVGVRPAMGAAEALALMALRPRALVALDIHDEERRHVIAEASGINVIVVDSNSLVAAGDAGAVVVTGSHGGVLGGRPQSAVKAPVAAAIYNDATVGIDGAGVGRLPALDSRGIPAAAVSAWSARIGDGLSTFEDGYVSCLNECGRAAGGEIGISCRELVARFVAAAARRAPTGKQQ
jgi:hypothetical protein